METEDFAGAGLRFANGALGALFATTAEYPGFPERIELIGTTATAVLAAGVVTLHHHDGRSERIGEEQSDRRRRRPDGLPPRCASRAARRLPRRARPGPRARCPRAARRCACTTSSTPCCARRSSAAPSRSLPRRADMADHPPLKFAAIGLDHRHIYHQVGRLLELRRGVQGLLRPRRRGAARGLRQALSPARRASRDARVAARGPRGPADRDAPGSRRSGRRSRSRRCVTART